MDTAVLALRTVLALVVVVGLVVVLGRVLDDRAAGRTQDGFLSRLLSPFKALLPGRSAAPKRRRSAPVLSVVGRQGLGPKASVAVVDVGGQRLVLGVSEAGVTLLTSMQAPAVEAEVVEVVEAVTAPATSLVKRDATPVATPVAAASTSTLVEPAAPLAFDEVFAGIVARQPEGTQGATSAPAPDAAVTEPVAAQPSGTAAQPGGTAAPVSTSPVAGSVLSPATWRQAVSAVQSRTRR